MLRLLVTLSKFLLLAIRTGTTSGLIFPHMFCEVGVT